MSRNMRFIIVALILALVAAIVMMPKKTTVEATIPVTASPVNGMAPTTPTAEQPTVAPAAPAAPQTGAEVDGVPAGTEATEDANQAVTTTPPPVETAPAPDTAPPAPQTQQ
jgi:hypothetical protein